MRHIQIMNKKGQVEDLWCDDIAIDQADENTIIVKLAYGTRNVNKERNVKVFNKKIEDIRSITIIY